MPSREADDLARDLTQTRRVGGNRRVLGSSWDEKARARRMLNFVYCFRAIFCFYNVIQEQFKDIIIIHDRQPRLGHKKTLQSQSFACTSSRLSARQLASSLCMPPRPPPHSSAHALPLSPPGKIAAGQTIIFFVCTNRFCTNSGGGVRRLRTSEYSRNIYILIPKQTFNRKQFPRSPRPYFRFIIIFDLII